MTEEINELIKLSLNKPLRLSADLSAKRPATLTEEVVRIRRTREGNQEEVLLALCSKAAHRLKILFGLAGFKAAELHGDLTQSQHLELKRAGSRLKNRIVAEQPISKWSDIMEAQVSSILLEERDEMAQRKSEMEPPKGENMIGEHDEIYSRRKRRWFVAENEKKVVAKAAKVKKHVVHMQCMILFLSLCLFGNKLKRKKMRGQDSGNEVVISCWSSILLLVFVHRKGAKRKLRMGCLSWMWLLLINRTTHRTIISGLV